MALPLPGRLCSEVAPLLAVMRHLQRQLAYSDERIAAVTATDERVRRLQSVPNVGPVTAAAFVAAIDDASRFRRGHEVEAYLGLVPREQSSGETQHRGRITKAGSSRVRWLLIQAAVSMLRLRDPESVLVASPPGAARVSPWSRSPGGSPGSSSRSCAIAPSTSRVDATPATSRMSCRSDGVRMVTGLPDLLQVRWVGERACCLGRCPRAAA
jgi:transposase IS116/IS110/IS902 family protein